MARANTCHVCSQVVSIRPPLREHLQGTQCHALHCPRAAPSVEVVSCTYYHWFRPFSKRRRYSQLPVFGRCMQSFLQFRLGSHNLPIVAGRFSGDQHVASVHWVCTHCGGIAVADELHMIHECPVLQPLRLQYAALFTPDDNTMRSFCTTRSHAGFQICLGLS